jgi:integrase
MPGKRGNGEGSIRQRESNGLWEARVTIDGKSHSLYGKTRAEANRKLTALKANRDKGLPPLEGGVTVERFLREWLEVKRGTLPSPRTYERYAEYVRLHITPALGKHKLAQLAPHHIQRLYSDKRATLAPRTVHHIHSVLHNALEHAVKQGLVYRNAADLTEAPKIRKREMLVWAREEARTFLRTAEQDRFYALYLLALTTTARQGELFGLTWRDIDFEASSVSIRAAVRRSKLRGTEMAIPKTDPSRRVIPIDPGVVVALREHRERKNQDRDLVGEAWIDRDLVFADSLGGPLRTNNLERRHFGPMMAKAGVPRIRFHDLRHTAATLLIAEGVPIGVVSQMLGHTSAAFTLSVYAHVLPGMGRDAAIAIGRALQ